MKLDDAKHLVRQRLIDENELPEVPAGWTVERLRFLFSESKERNGKEPVGEMLSVSEYYGVTPKEYDAEERKRADDEIENYRVVRPGQLAVNSMWLNHLGLGVSNYLGYVSPAYGVYNISDRLDRRFVHHLLRSQFYLRIYTRYLYGIRPNSFQIKSYDWANIPVIVPDLASQKQIADFLDAETARIDALIKKKQRLIEVVGEGLAACLEGLTSPTEKNADTIPFRWVCRVVEGQVDPTHPDWVGAPLIAPNHIQSGTGRLLAVETADQQGAISGKYAYPSGTVLYSKIRPALAKACIAPDAGMCSADMYPILPDRRLTPAFLLMQLLSRRFTDWATLESMRVAMPKINRNTLGNYRLWVPSRNTQAKNAEIFATARDKAEATIDLVEASITRLREYRAALITAAVTGQIDVAAHARLVETAQPRASGEVVTLRPVAIPDRRTLRVLVAAEVVHRLGSDPYLGRTKLQKLMFLAEAHANINDIAGRYQRYRYGPYDDAMVQEIELGLRQDGYYDTRGGTGVDREKVAFQQMSRAEGHRDALAAALGGKTDTLRQLVDLFKGKDTAATEAVATLYAVWNDALIDGKQPDDAAIIRGFLQDWHPEKGKFKQADLQTWLGWMRRHGLVPKGTGPRTVSSNTPSLFERQ